MEAIHIAMEEELKAKLQGLRIEQQRIAADSIMKAVVGFDQLR